MNIHLRNARIIWAAMVLGMMSFIGIGYAAATPSDGPFIGHVSLLMVVWGALAVSLLLAFVALRIALLGTIRRRWRENPHTDDPVNDLSSHWWVQWLIGAVMIEAVGLFATLIYFTEQQELALGCSTASIIAMLLWAPTRGGMRSFAETVTRSPIPSEAGA